jgi:hypothetical protein
MVVSSETAAQQCQAGKPASVNSHLIRGVLWYIQYRIVRRIAALLEQSHVGEEARSYAGWLSAIWSSMITSQNGIKRLRYSVSLTDLCVVASHQRIVTGGPETTLVCQPP